MRKNPIIHGSLLFCLFFYSCTSTPRDPNKHVGSYRQKLHEEGLLHSKNIFGYEICYSDQGQGNTLILLHGIGGSLYDWRKLTPLLVEQGFRVIAVDLLGAGESSKPEEGDYSIAAQARRVRALMDQLEIQKAVICGNSYGGGVSLALARDWPERVEKLVLIDSVCYKGNVPFYASVCKIGWLPEQVIQILPVESTIKKTLASAQLSNEEVLNYAEEIRLPGRRQVIAKTLRTLLQGDIQEWEASLKTIRVPTLILWGAKDKTLSQELGKRLAEEIPDAQLVIF